MHREGHDLSRHPFIKIILGYFGNGGAIMKIIAAVFLVIVMMAASLAACTAVSTTADPHPGFSIQYIRTNGYHGQRAYPIVTVIRSKAELSAYYDKYQD
jgi:hypothetical protein